MEETLLLRSAELSRKLTDAKEALAGSEAQLSVLQEKTGRFTRHWRGQSQRSWEQEWDERLMGMQERVGEMRSLTELLQQAAVELTETEERIKGLVEGL